MTDKVKHIPDGYHTVTPYLIVHDAAAIDFYKRAFEAKEVLRIEHGGKVGHAEIQIADSRLMLASEHPEMGARSARSIGGSPVGLVLYVGDVDGWVARAASLGAKILRPVEDKFYGDRMGSIEDPFGLQWHVATHIEDVSPEELQKRAAAVPA